MILPNVIAYSLMIALFGAAFAAATGFPDGAKEYPMLVAAVGAALCAALTINAVWGYLKLKKDPDKLQEARQKHEKAKLRRRDYLHVAIAIIAISTYAILIPFLGFYLSTLLFMVGSMTLLKPRKVYVYALVAVLYLLMIYFVFDKTLHIFLPSGTLF